MERSLLVLDDDEFVGAYIQRAAATVGLSARATTTVRAFTDQLALSPPTDIILDLQLGADDGVEVLRQLAGRGCTAGIILLSGFDDKVLAAARSLGVELGLNIRHTLTKPVRLPALQAALKLEEGAAKPVPVAPSDLERGIARGELVLEYQPIVGCQNLDVRGVEALVRWKRDGGLRVPPGAFVPVAEANAELMDLLTMNVIEQAARDWRTLAVSGRRTSISVNVSAQNLRRLDFPERVASVVLAAGVPASGIKLEITETAMADHQATLDTLVRLRLKGFLLSMDDFGTGFTSIAMLRRMPFTELKIDRSFICDIVTSEDALAVARGIVALGRSIGLSTLAEGVETQEVLNVVKSLGTGAAQGFLICRPLPLERLLPWLVERREGVARGVSDASA